MEFAGFGRQSSWIGDYFPNTVQFEEKPAKIR